MKKFCFAFFTLILLAVWCISDFKAEAQNESNQSVQEAMVSPNLVISQFQVAGDNSANAANDEFIELHNTSANTVDLNGYRVVYRSAGGTNDVLFAEWTNSTLIPAGGYYLIGSTSYNGAAAANFIYNPTTCSCSMSGTGGGLAIRSGAVNTGTIIDSVGYGTATNVFIETAVTAAASTTGDNSKVRASNGCQDTDNNSNDFSTLSPSAPRNAATAPITCSGGGGTTIFAAMSANPTTTSPGGTVLLTVTVIPATTPPSTGISVIGNLSTIGGSASQTFFDDGTNGDATAGDNVFSYTVVISAGTAGGSYNVTAVAADAQARTANTSTSITVNAQSANEDPLILGNPSNATTDVANENNYLMQKPQYTLSYNRSKATTNWTAWRLDSSWIGSAARQNDFRPDTTLPAGWYQVTDSDYSGSGYDRGHMCPSGDRTNSTTNNSATFLMTNMVPQLAANNQGPWEELETYCRTLASQGNEMYIISGPVGNIGTIAGGKVVVPQYTWKVVMVLSNGADDIHRINRSTRVFGIIVPNFPPLNINAPWRDFRVTVNQIENLTGYNFFSNVPKITQELIERKRDRL